MTSACQLFVRLLNDTHLVRNTWDVRLKALRWSTERHLPLAQVPLDDGFDEDGDDDDDPAADGGAAARRREKDRLARLAKCASLRRRRRRLASFSFSASSVQRFLRLSRQSAHTRGGARPRARSALLSWCARSFERTTRTKQCAGTKPSSRARSAPSASGGACRRNTGRRCATARAMSRPTACSTARTRRRSTGTSRLRHAAAARRRGRRRWNSVAARALAHR